MITWELEHLPVSGGSTRQSLAAWGISAAQLALANWDADALVVQTGGATALTDAMPFGYLDKVILWRDGVRVFHGWLTTPQRAASPESESQVLRFDGPWWWLTQMGVRPPKSITDIIYSDVEISAVDPEDGVVTKTVRAATGCTWVLFDDSTVVWPSPGGMLAQSVFTVQGQIARAIYSAVGYGAPITLGTVDLDGRAPEQSTRNATCAMWVQSAASNIPFCAGWWDYTGTVPAFCACEREDIPAFSHALGDSYHPLISIAPLYSQQVRSVEINYYYPVEGGDDSRFWDRAGDLSAVSGPGVLRVDIDCDDYDSALESSSLHIAAKIYDACSDLAWGGSLAISESPLWYRPGHSLNLTGGRTEWEAMRAIIQQVTHDITPEGDDACSITLGAPEHLGVQDWLEIARAAGDIAGSNGGDGSDPAPETPGPGPINGLNGAAGEYTPSVNVETQARGGSCQIFGFQEYDGHVSSPPRRYRQITASGTVTNLTGPSCAELTPANYDVYSGTTVISPITGLCTASAIRTNTIVPNPPTVYPYHTIGMPAELPYAYGDSSGTTWTTAKGATWTQRTFNDVCYTDGLGPRKATGSERFDLSDEDTESDAIARQMSGAEWATGEALSVYTVRTGVAFSCTEFRFRATIGTTPVDKPQKARPWAPYILRAQLQDRPAGTTVPWVDSEVVDVPFSADLNGAATIDWQQPIRAPQGTERRLAYVTIISG